MFGSYIVTRVIDQVLFDILTACIDSALSKIGSVQSGFTTKCHRTDGGRLKELVGHETYGVYGPERSINSFSLNVDDGFQRCAVWS